MIISIDGRSFSRVTRRLAKPFCDKFVSIMNHTMANLAKQIDGVVFGYQYSDKIILVLRNDQTNETDPWFGNNIQKIASVSAASATYEFMNHLISMGDSAPELNGKIVFSANAFGLPGTTEVINYLTLRQLHCAHTAVNEAVYSVLSPKYGKDTAAFLEDKSVGERKDLIEEYGGDFDSLKQAYRYGSSVYSVPFLVETAQGQVNRNKWVVDFNITAFSEDQSSLRTIIDTGSDVFRAERDL